MKGNPDMPQCGFSRAVAQAPCPMFQGWNHLLSIMDISVMYQCLPYCLTRVISRKFSTGIGGISNDIE